MWKLGVVWSSLFMNSSLNNGFWARLSSGQIRLFLTTKLEHSIAPFPYLKVHFYHELFFNLHSLVPPPFTFFRMRKRHSLMKGNLTIKHSSRTQTITVKCYREGYHICALLGVGASIMSPNPESWDLNKLFEFVQHQAIQLKNQIVREVNLLPTVQTRPCLLAHNKS